MRLAVVAVIHPVGNSCRVNAMLQSGSAWRVMHITVSELFDKCRIPLSLIILSMERAILEVGS